MSANQRFKIVHTFVVMIAHSLFHILSSILCFRCEFVFVQISWFIFGSFCSLYVGGLFFSGSTRLSALLLQKLLFRFSFMLFSCFFQSCFFGLFCSLLVLRFYKIFLFWISNLISNNSLKHFMIAFEFLESLINTILFILKALADKSC